MELNHRALEIGLAVGLGAVVPTIGFPPLNSAPDVLDIDFAPWRVVLVPATLVALTAAGIAVVTRAREGVGRPAFRIAVAAWVVLLAGFLLSLLSSDDLWYSVLIGVLGLASPMLLWLAIARSTLPTWAIAAGFLGATTLMVLRAEWLFFDLHGLPTAEVLYDVKFQSRPYDFHYYLLNNPNGAAAFIILPFGVSLFWLLEFGVSRLVRLLLAMSTALLSLAAVLVYTRSALAMLILLVILAIAIAPWTRRTRLVACATVMLVALPTAVAVSGDYFVSSLVDGTDATSQDRLESIETAWDDAFAHPLTGVGLGRYNVIGGYVPAHSALVQSAVEMGIAGLLGFGLLCLAAISAAVSLVRAGVRTGPQVGAAVASAAYLVYCACVGGASEALYSAYNPVWGLSLGLLLGLASRSLPQGTELESRR